MDGNKDEALRCVRIAEESIAIGNKDRALKFIQIAQRLNPNLPLHSLLNHCSTPKINPILNGNKSYTEENVQLVREIKGKSDYYAILGLDRSCSFDEIRKAYRKISLKIHPDKNKAPGSEDAFKKVSKAFKCLSDYSSRWQYDQTGLVDEFKYNQQNYTNVRRQRRRATTAHDFFEDEFDPDVIFRPFFRQSNVFDRNRVYRTRTTTSNHNNRQESQGDSGLNIMLLIQLLPFLLILLLVYLPFSEPNYSLHENYPYQIPMMTEEYEVQFFVKSEDFDAEYPPGSPARAEFDDSVVKDYRSMLHRFCKIEMQRRTWNRNLPTPHCEKLKSFRVASA